MDSSDSVSVVALIISVIALIGTVLQLLQQYFSSAEGYSSCGEQVMGPWAMYRFRKFRWTELRFEVQFETPVIFVCPPSNKKGPVKDHALWFVEGTAASEETTRTPSIETEKMEQNQQRESKNKSIAVHTADNERASWFILLQALHTMEKSSMAWQTQKLSRDKTDSGPPGKTVPPLPGNVASWDQHTAVVALQPKLKSWDTMPAEVRKPYATSTICHVIEMAAMLGLHWREFNRSEHKYHAEGNGYMLTGQSVKDLGIMFHFQIYAANKFESNRVIPNDSIKLLAFGDAWTIFRPDPADETTLIDDDDPKSSGMLHLGSTTELVETLTYYGCNAKTANYFHDDKMRHGHLFPIVFEVLGMVGESVYLPNTYYRFIPNPTTFFWNRKNVSLRKLILEYSHNLTHDHRHGTSDHMKQLQVWTEALGERLEKWADKNDFSMVLLTCLHQTIEKCNTFLTGTPRVKKEVPLVLRTHIQEVMKLLNETAPAPSKDGGDDADSSGDETTLLSKDRAPTFDDLNSATPEERQNKLMQIYFRTVRPAVLKSRSRLEKRNTSPYVPSVASRSDLALSSGDKDEAAPSTSPTPPPRRSSTPQLRVVPDGEEDGHGGAGRAWQQQMPTEAADELTEEVWCTLVLRMLCWLLLHDFNKKDVQISKSELYQSRLPVFIA